MFVWKSEDGSIRSFSAMSNEHLANVILHLKHYDQDKHVLRLAQDEAEHRCLSPAFLLGAPYPWKNERNSSWYIWDFNVHHSVQING